MKKRFFALGCAILISGAAIMGIGTYIKYDIMKPLGLGQDENVIALPFLLMADPGLRRSVEVAMNGVPNASEPTAAPPTTSEPAVTTPITTEPSTTPPVTTVPPSTVPPTTAPIEPVDESWYDDVLFIGDSRTCGLRDYARRGNADYFGTIGMTVFNYDRQWASDDGFDDESLDSLLSSKTYGKIFIGLGINEAGYPVDTIMEDYRGLVSYIQQMQPDAVIILEAIMTVSREKAKSATYFNPTNLFTINKSIAALADGEKIFYIDVNELFADEDGYLPPEIAGDGCHPYPEYYQQWADWISDAVAHLGL